MTSFFGELRRRNVVRVAVAYAIVGWLLIEVSSVIAPAMNLPDWATSLVVFFVILGFPLALILSWAYEITPEGIKLERDVATGERITHVTGRKLDFAIIGALVLALGFVVYNYESGDGEVVAGVLPNSVAVLPFENMSVDPEEAFYASGIHEEILNQLVKLSALNVIARTSMQQYANTEKSIPEIAKELNVETVMEGSVRYDAGRIRITVQLNDGVTGAHLWSETYTRDFNDIFAIESDVAMNVANALAAEFSLAEQEAIEQPPTSSSEAYAFYLRAMAIWDGSETAIGSLTVRNRVESYLNQAIEADADFALAYVKRAYLYVLILNQDPGSGEDFPAHRAELEGLALEDLERAMTLDPDLGGAYGILARIHQYNWRGAEARQAYERALESSPNDPRILMDYATFNALLSQYGDAFRLGQRALELDPNNGIYHDALSGIYAHAGDLPAAVATVRHAIELTPTNADGYWDLADYEGQLGNDAEALDQLRIAERLLQDHTNPVVPALLAYMYSRIDQTDDADRLFQQLQEDSATRRIPQTAWILGYLAIGDEESALEWLNRAADSPQYYEGHFGMAWMSGNGYHDSVLDQPEFVAVRQRLGFTDL